MENILAPTEQALVLKKMGGSLNAYTQANCSCTLTDNGYRIYRPANKNPSADGNTMWGGLCIYPFNISSTALQKSHSYVLKFHIKGQSSNVADFGWTNWIGWGGGGLSPTPTLLYSSNIPSNFNGEHDFVYAWTINDDIYKTCTNGYGNKYVTGNSYLSYEGFKWGFSYTDTGALGTDVYITDIRMYDITNIDITEIKKNGILETGSFEEITGNFRMAKDYETMSNYFYEI